MAVGTLLAARQCTCLLSSAACISCGQAIQQHPDENTSGRDKLPVLVSLLDPTEAPAAATVFEVLDMAVLGSRSGSCGDGTPTVALAQPHRAQMSLAPVGRLEEASGNKAPGVRERAPANAAAVRRVERDVIAL